MHLKWVTGIGVNDHTAKEVQKVFAARGSPSFFYQVVVLQNGEGVFGVKTLDGSHYTDFIYEEMHFIIFRFSSDKSRNAVNGQIWFNQHSNETNKAITKWEAFDPVDLLNVIHGTFGPIVDPTHYTHALAIRNNHLLSALAQVYTGEYFEYLPMGRAGNVVHFFDNEITQALFFYFSYDYFFLDLEGLFFPMIFHR